MHYRKLSDIVAGQQILAGPPEMTVFDAAQAMRLRNVGAVLVMEGDALLGIVTERDIAFRLVAEGLDPRESPLSAIMSREIYSLPDDRMGLDAVRMMEHHRIRHIVVVRAAGGYGIVSARDFSSAELAEGARLHAQATDLWEHL